MTATLDTSAATPSFTVGTESARRVEATARRLGRIADGRVDSPEWVAATRDSWPELPPSLQRALRGFRRDSGPTGALLIRGLPVDEPWLPKTPAASGSVQRTADVTAAMLLMVAAGLGDPAAFRAEKQGALVQDVVPVPGQEDFQGNAGSVLLTFHTENAFHPHRPDFVLLLCLRTDHERIAGLRTACIRQALPMLSDEARQALALPEFVTAAPPSFGTGGGRTPHAVLTGAPEDPDLCVDFAATEAVTPRAGRALLELQQAFELTARTAVLEPGDLAVVDNRVTVHGRTAFRPRYDGRDRWLRRSFVLTDLRRSRAESAANSYVLD
jgi:L-asparagine oxygenase